MFDYTLLFQITYTKESIYTELFTLLFQIIYKKVVYIELIPYLIKKQSVNVRKRYLKNIPKKKRKKDGGQFTFLREELSRFLIFGDFLITHKKKKMEYSLEFFNFIPIDLEYQSESITRHKFTTFS